MPTNLRFRKRKNSQTRLSDDDAFFLEAGLHLDGSVSTLTWDDPRARDLYQKHRAALFERSHQPGLEGWRPAAFWHYEATRDPETNAARLRHLRENGLLRPEELATLQARHKRLKATGFVGCFDEYPKV